MSADFDPYQKWLGIPPAEQPPTHYRLLNLPQGDYQVLVIHRGTVAASKNVQAYRTDGIEPFGPVER